MIYSMSTATSDGIDESARSDARGQNGRSRETRERGAVIYVHCVWAVIQSQIDRSKWKSRGRHDMQCHYGI